MPRTHWIAPEATATVPRFQRLVGNKLLRVEEEKRIGIRMLVSRDCALNRLRPKDAASLTHWLEEQH